MHALRPPLPLIAHVARAVSRSGNVQMMRVAVEGKYGGIPIRINGFHCALVVAGIGDGIRHRGRRGLFGGLERSQRVGGWFAASSAQVSSERGGDHLFADRQRDVGG